MPSTDPRRPNVVCILCDDLGIWALGAYGNAELQSPNLDRLAAEGTRFDRFFCSSPVCSPARATLLTGRIPSQHGVHDWLREGNMGPDAIEYLAGQRAYTEIMAEHGYHCGLSGKWHLGDSLHPQKGFAHWYVHQCGGGNYYDAPMVRHGQPINQPGYVTDNITDDAIGFLQERSGEPEPFYLSVHYTAPHSPWIDNHPPEIVARYDDCEFATCPNEPPHPWAANFLATGNQRENRKGYFAAVTAMDLAIGRLVDRLETLGLRQNTLLIFLSDNGFSLGHHGIWGKGNATFPQNMYENSILVPAIMSHPARMPGGRVCAELVSGYDFMPTLLDYCGLPHGDEALPGISFAPWLDGGQQPHRDSVVVFDEYGPVRMIRTRDWKYVHRYPYGPHELYDLESDPDERVNLVDQPTRQDQVEELRAQLEDWFIRYTDPRRDGTHEGVTGKGQVGLAGPAARGRSPYWPATG